MNKIISFLENFVQNPQNFGYLIVLILSVFNFLKTGNIKKFLSEVLKMKYKTEKSIYKSIEELKGEDFTGTNLVKQYRLNSKGDLEETGEVVDIQEVIDSAKNLALESIMQKFSEYSNADMKVDNENVAICQTMQDDLDILSDYYEEAEQMRDKYNLDSKLTVAEIFDVVRQKKTDLEKVIAEEKAKRQALEQLKKEVLEKGGVDDEKKTDEQKSK